MSNDDLRALISAVSKALDREREDRIRDRSEDHERMTRIETRADKNERVLIRWGAAVALVFGLAMWFGPTRLSALVQAIFGAP